MKSLQWKFGNSGDGMVPKKNTQKNYVHKKGDDPLHILRSEIFSSLPLINVQKSPIFSIEACKG